MKKTKFTVLISLIALLSTINYGCKKSESPNPSSSTNNNPITPPVASLLSGAQTGTAYTGSINDFTLASNGSSVVLLAAQNATGKIFAIDLKDNDASAAAANTVTASTENFMVNLAATAGIPVNQIRLLNFEVNPISKSIYVLVSNNQTNQQSIFRITGGGATITALNVSNVTYSTINFATGQRINDMAWGDGKLYFSFSNAGTLNGEVAVVRAPFAHNGNATRRATTVFKSNWGNVYNTNAPLESMAYGEVDGEKRLMGVTVCAPGYSFRTSEIESGAGLLQVKEYFNLNTGIAQKVFCVGSGASTALVEVHMDGRIVSVGKKYLNGSQAENVRNGNFLLAPNGSRAAGLTDQDIKIIAPAGTYYMATKYTDNKLLVVTANGALSVLDI